MDMDYKKEFESFNANFAVVYVNDNDMVDTECFHNAEEAYEFAREHNGDVCADGNEYERVMQSFEF